MRFCGKALIPLIFALLSTPSAAPAGLVVSSWNLACFVRDAFGNIDSAGITTVQSPLSAMHQGTIPPSVAAGSYVGSFDPHTFSFRVDYSLNAAGAAGSPIPPLQAGCSGSIVVTSDVALLLSVDGSMTYALAGGDREANLSISARESGGPYYFIGGGDATPAAGDPPAGVFPAHADSILLPANHVYGLNYSARLFSFTGSASQLSSATGWVQFNLTLAPEPSALVLACFAFLAPRRRRS